MGGRIGIIGAGPAGLTAAISAAKRGLNVTLWEKDQIGENISCAEGFFDTLRKLDKPVGGIQQPINSLQIKVENEYELDVSGLNLWMIDRREWQTHLAEKARKQGVIIIENKKIGPGDLSNLQQEFDYILDASGVPSVTSLQKNFRHIYTKQALFTLQYRVKGDFSHLPQTIRVILLPESNGYGWIFPKNDERANIGIGLFDFVTKKKPGKELEITLDTFCAGEDIMFDSITSKSGGICPNDQPSALVYDNILLLGDSAGLTSPLHGGGLDLACLSGELAVQLVAEKEVKNYFSRLQEIKTEKFKLEKVVRNFIINHQRRTVDRFVNYLENKFNRYQPKVLFDNKLARLITVFSRLKG